MDNEITIRLANDADFNTIYQIWLEGVDNSFEKDAVDEATLHTRFKRNFNNRAGIFNYWVAEKDEVLLGWQSLIKASFNPYREDMCAESSTYIAKESRIKGIGELLLRFVINEAEKSKLHYVIGYVAADNVAVRKITARTGWVEVGELPFLPKDVTAKRKIFLVRLV